MALRVVPEKRWGCAPAMVMLLLVLGLGGCVGSCTRDIVKDAAGEVPVPAEKIGGPPPASNGTVKDKAQRVAEIEGELAKAKAELDQAKKAQAEERLAWLNTLMLWCAALGFLGAVGCTVAAILSPAFKKTLLTAAVASLGGAVVALTLQWALPYLLWVGIIGAVGAIIWGITYIRHLTTATALASDHGDRMEGQLERMMDLAQKAGLDIPMELAPHIVKAESKAKQAAAKVQDTIQKIRNKL